MVATPPKSLKSRPQPEQSSTHDGPLPETPVLSGESLVYFGPEPWEGLWRNRHQLMSRFARHNRVLYVEPAFFTLRRIRRVLRNEQQGWKAVWPPGVERKRDNLFVLRSPLWLCLLGKHPFNRIKRAYWRHLLRRAARRLDMKAPIVWLSRPEMLRSLGALEEKLSIYHVVDEYAGYGGLSDEDRRLLEELEAEMVDRADLTVVVSHALLESKGRLGGRVHLLANAVDYEAYRPRPDRPVPPDMAAIPRPIVGYSGLVGGRLNLDLLRMLARRHPEWSLVFVGDVRRTHCEETLAVLEALPNVYFLGRKPVEETPAYVRAFDACIVPYCDDLRANHASPLKIYEYAAAERPIVATRFAAAEELSDFVLVADDEEHFERSLSEALRWPASHPRLRLGAEVARCNTWEHRVADISQVIQDAIGAKHRGELRPSDRAQESDRRARVLYIVEHVTGGSIESLCLVIEQLDQRRFEPLVLFLNTPGYPIRSRLGDVGAKMILPTEDAPQIGLEGPRLGLGLYDRLSRLAGGRLLPLYYLARRVWKLLFDDLATARFLHKQTKDIAFDLVHINEGISRGKAGVLLALWRGVPSICHERMWQTCTGAEKLFARWVGRIVYNSLAVKSHEVRQGIPADRGVVIHNAVDLDVFAGPRSSPRPREAFGWNKDHCVIGVVGRLDWWKGHDYFLPAFARLLKDYPHARALIIGEREPSARNARYADALMEIRYDLGLEEHVIFTGHRDDVAQLIRDLDLLVHCSSEPEPFGRVVIEGMAAGRAVVAVDAGGVPEIIEHGRTGLLVPGKDADALTEAMSSLIADSKLAERLGAAARREVKARFTVDTHMDQVQSLYEALLDAQARVDSRANAVSSATK